MLTRLHELAAQRVSFAFETTLASRTFAPWIIDLKKTGYLFHLIYLWLPSPELAVARVAQRVLRKGHHVPDDLVRRRYARGLKNFFNLYCPVVNTWRLYNSALPTGPLLIAENNGNCGERVIDSQIWSFVKREAQNGT